MSTPLGETTVTRSWRWGAAVLGDPAAAPPSPTAELVTTGASALVLRLRRSQDDSVTATCHVRVLSEAEPTQRSLLCDVVLDTASGKLSLGDAAGAVAIEVEGAPRHRVLVSAERLDSDGLDEVWVDVVPVTASA